MRVGVIAITALAMSACGQPDQPPPEPLATETSECTITDARFESTAEPREHVGFCVERDGSNVVYVACVLSADQNGRDPKEIEFHSADGESSEINIDRWETPECATAAVDARPWLEARTGR